MKIIISHDVDHLCVREHLLRDFFIPKWLIRSVFQLCRGKISIKTFFNRFLSVFSSRYNRIKEVMEIDAAHGIISTFFFGMEKGLGMSYDVEKAVPYIQMVCNQGFDVGVHGIEYTSVEGIKKEYEKFKQIVMIEKFGIRMHYVRYDDSTFEKLENSGYCFDTTQFNKKRVEILSPYKIGDLWEFPLHIMDGYVYSDGELGKGINKTKQIIAEAERKSIPYCTILFHDCFYNEKCYPTGKAWYDWLLNYLEENEYEIISYRDAIRELEEKEKGREDDTEVGVRCK